MEFFNSAKAVRLQSHLGKYLQADDDNESVRQTRNGGTPHVCWTVELVAGKPHVIRLKSCFGKYLTASQDPFILGTAGKKVVQADPGSDEEWEWEPRRDGFFVKLRTRAGLFLRANGGAPPWRNSVTHDIPRRRSTQEWVLWSVDVVHVTALHYSPIAAISPAESFSSHSSRFSSVSDYDFETPSPSMSISSKDLSAMELFQRARAVRLRSHHDKYLVAEDDEESVSQDRNGLIKNAKWTVEFVKHSNRLRLMSCFGKYLTAAAVPFLLGMTGNKVLQTMPQCFDSKTEWEPIREGFQVKLKTSHGQFLRANGGLPPWRNSVTHDIPHRTATQDWILWEVDVVEIQTETILLPKSHRSCSRDESSESLDLTPVKVRGRVICYHIANEKGDVIKEEDEVRFTFEGTQVEELKERLKEETGINDIIICSRNPLNGRLYPLRLHLPPNNTDIHIVVVPSSSDIEAPENP